MCLILNFSRTEEADTPCTHISIPVVVSKKSVSQFNITAVSNGELDITS
jgi:hypothetical protein